jgi:hypothetical protein
MISISMFFYPIIVLVILIFSIISIVEVDNLTFNKKNEKGRYILYFNRVKLDFPLNLCYFLIPVPYMLL